MKVLYVYDSMPKGYQAFLTLTLEGLREKSNVSTLAYEKNGKADYNISSYGVLDFYQRLLFKLKLSKYKSRDIYVMSKFDVIHVQHSYLFPKILPLINTKYKRPKIIITLRGADTYIKPWVFENWNNFFTNQSQNIDAFITVSYHQKKYLQKWGILESKIHVIPISFGSKSNAEPKYSNKEILKIISAHRMCWEKNIEGNLRTVKVLKEKGINVQYDVYGDGPDLGQVYYLIEKYGLEKEVNCFGKIENAVFKEKLKFYDFYLQLSHSESFGGSVIEAQSFGVPCIVSNSGGLPEAIIHGETGYCVDAYNIDLAVNYIIELFQDSNKYHSFSKKAIEYVNENFTTTIEIEKLTTLYKRLLIN